MLTIKRLLLKVISSRLPLCPHLAPCVHVPRHGAKWLFEHLPTLSGAISSGWSSGWIQRCRSGLGAASPITQRSLHPRTMRGPDLVPLLSIPPGGSEGMSSSRADPAWCCAGMDGETGRLSHRGVVFPSLAVCREEPSHRDSRPGPSVPADELPPRGGASRTSSARFPPWKQNQMFLCKGTVSTGLVLQTWASACSSHPLLLEGVISELRCCWLIYSIAFQLAIYIYISALRRVLYFRRGGGKTQEERALQCSVPCPAWGLLSWFANELMSHKYQYVLKASHTP